MLRDIMTKDELVFTLKEKLLTSRRALKGYAQSRKVTELLRLYTPFLNLDTPNNIRCWHLIYNVDEIPICAYCRVSSPKFNNNKWGYLDYCSVKCQRNSPIVKQKLAEAIEKKYGEGITNPFMSQTVKDDIRKKMLSKFGVDHNFKRKDLIITSMRSRYGVNHYSQTSDFKEKYTQTIVEKYGVEHYSQTQEFLEKCKLTWKSTLGVDHPMHDPEIADRVLSKLHKMKKVVLPNGKIASLQGYEPYALSILYRTHDINDIVIGKKQIESHVGKILYTDFSGKIRQYYPDFYIISSNTIIEVKSTWTYDKNGNVQNDKNINLLKKDACLKLGFMFSFIIVDKLMIEDIKKCQDKLEVIQNI